MRAECAFFPIDTCARVRDSLRRFDFVAHRLCLTASALSWNTDVRNATNRLYNTIIPDYANQLNTGHMTSLRRIIEDLHRQGINVRCVLFSAHTHTHTYHATLHRTFETHSFVR